MLVQRLRQLGMGVVVSASLATGAFANNVQVAVEGSLLKVFGDNVANSVNIKQSAVGDVTVSGFNGTLINGLPSVQYPGLAINAVEIRMEGGNDIVQLDGLVIANDLYVSLGEGSDSLVNLSAISVGNNLNVEGGAGNDALLFTEISVAEDVSIDGGLGSLSAAITLSDLGKALNIVSDAANDSITIQSSVVADMINLDLKAGSDRVSVTNVSAYAFSASTDLGADVLTLTNVTTLEDVGIFTGDGNDTVTLTSVTSGKSITVSVDAGHDLVRAKTVRAAEDAVFEGGAGIDRLKDAGITGGKKKDIKEFEFVYP